MPSLGLIIGLASLTLCWSAHTTMSSDKAKCEKPPEIENTTLLGNWNEEAYPQNHTANYSCRPGYVMMGRIRMTCLDGKWVMLRNGQCKKKLCPHPGETPFVSFELKNESQFVFGAVVEYSCVEGYQMMSKHRTRTCAVDGWTNAIPHCEVRLCPPVKDDSLRVTSPVSDDEFTYGQVINLKCKNPKDSLKGPSSIYCTENGTWNTDPPTCKASCTVQVHDMRTHNVQLKEYPVLNYRDNEDVGFECISGYEITDPAELIIKCNNGVLKYPACHKIVNTSCSRPPFIKYGEIITSRRNYYESGSSVRYKCPYLYNLHGPEVVRCQCGMWSAPPMCLAPCSTNAQKMSENHIMLMWKKQNKKLCVRNNRMKKYAEKCYVQHNDAIQFVCVSGYRISDPRYLISMCHRGDLPYPRCSKGK